MSYIVNGNDESGYHVTDPDGHITPVGSRWAAEDYARQQNQLLQQSGTTYVPSESFADSLKSCAYMIVGIVIAVIVVALIVNFIILHGWWPIP